MTDFELKRLSSDGIPDALQKANRYRLLNEPGAAESICRDVLEVDAGNHEAAVTLLLSLSDQFPRGIAGRYEEAMRLVGGLSDEYDRTYYRGLMAERRAKAHYRQGTPGCSGVAWSWFATALAAYEEAERLRPKGNDSSLVRWNTCVRFIRKHADLRPGHEPSAAPVMDE